jgi:signal transduction histidine kinase
MYSAEEQELYTCSPYAVQCDDAIKYFKIKYKPFIGSDNKTYCVHIHAIDITEEENRSIELKKINQVKDEFFTIMSHELRTPLTIIYSSLQLANKIYVTEITPNIKKTFTRIDQNCGRLLKLINNILDLSKIEAGFLELNDVRFDIVEFTESIVNMVNSYAINKGVSLIFDTNEEEIELTLDKDKYEKILLNLLSNAIKFTGEGKSILINLNIDNKYIHLDVKDEGIGIPQSKINCIFDRYVQINNSLSRRAEGTGLGLALVKSFVELMNGDIKVFSEEGNGTTFSLCFERNNTERNLDENCSIMFANINDRINIEFSDIY